MPIYLDNAATTRVCPEAAQAAFEVMTERYGNPSSRHVLGGEAAARLKADRALVATSLGCEPTELTFTSCGTEGDNWAVRGAAEYGRRKGKHIVTTAVEHSAVLEPLKELEQQGWEVTRLKPDRDGRITPEQVENALRPDTALVTMMLVNNELGTLLPVREAALAIRERGCPALLHTDAVQGFCKVPFTVQELGADLVSISGHKIGAPKGIGALYIRKGIKLKPTLAGGGQEEGLRPGTEPTAQIAALAAACQVWRTRGAEYTKRMKELKDYALESITREIPEMTVVSAGDAPHICALSLPGYPSEMVVRALSDRGIYLSSGSACHRGKPSHVFAALGRSKQELTGVLRVSFGPENTKEDVDALRQALKAIRDERVPVR